ncbi:MAG: rRNA maturation RNase YbeY [Alphaproteobacteria bacterium]|nr:rRNA maturation RNase YbeY [Alphaproteobacteria bacterium]
MIPIVTLLINDPRWLAFASEDEWCQKFAQGAEALFQHVDAPQAALEISIVLTNDEESHVLNLQYRGQDKPTNVLSFPGLDPDDLSAIHDPDMPLLLGDIVVSLETVLKETEQQGKIFEHHVMHLIIHGILHLLGYDHEHEADAAVMESLEVIILKNLGINTPYIE